MLGYPCFSVLASMSETVSFISCISEACPVVFRSKIFHFTSHLSLGIRFQYYLHFHSLNCFLDIISQIIFHIPWMHSLVYSLCTWNVYECYFEVLVLCLSFNALLRAYCIVCYILECILLWLLVIIYLHWCIGILACNDCHFRCQYMVFYLLGQCFVHWFQFLPLVLNTVWWLRVASQEMLLWYMCHHWGFLVQCDFRYWKLTTGIMCGLERGVF